jgi:predicted hydrocarbon binding protein
MTVAWASDMRLGFQAIPRNHMPDTVDALLPLSILEAVRNVDTPEGDYDAEYVQELRNKRLGLSDTVYTQIKRYTEAARRGQRPSFDEAVALAKLIGRRPDAETVLRAAGRYIARESYLTIGPGMRRMIHILPSLIARPLAFRRARKIADRYLDGEVTRVGSHLLLIVPRSVTIGTAPGETGCVYYEAAFKELLRLLVSNAGTVEHVRCVVRGEQVCEWRAEWRSGPRSR